MIIKNPNFMKAAIEEVMFQSFLAELSLDREDFLDLADDFEFMWTEDGRFIGIAVKPVNAESFEKMSKKFLEID